MDAQSARIWMAMDIGPLWIGRDEEDPLSPEAIMRDEVVSKGASLETPQAISANEGPAEVTKGSIESAVVAAQPQSATFAVSSKATLDMAKDEPKQLKALSENVVDIKQSVSVKRLDSPGTHRKEIHSLTPLGLPKDTPGEVTQKPVSKNVVDIKQSVSVKRLDSPGTHRKEIHSLTPLGLPKDTPGEVTQKPVSKEMIAQADWAQLRDFVGQCQACQSMCSSRLSTVFGVMEPTARMVIVGEAPGRDEDIQGLPFVGKSGELLENILIALGLQRGKDVAIINVLKCRPPKNRDPHPAEIAMCRPYLERQLALLSPKVVILSGRIAAQALLGTDKTMKQLRQNLHSLVINGQNVPTIVTYHPSYLLRSPSDKLQAWRDFMAAKHTLLGI